MGLAVGSSGRVLRGGWVGFCRDALRKKFGLGGVRWERIARGIGRRSMGLGTTGAIGYERGEEGEETWD